MSANPDATFQRGRGGSRRPPMVRFFRRSRFDQVETTRKGRSSYVDEDAVKITSPDGGVATEMPITEWFRQMSASPADWGQWEHGFRRMYEDWRAARDPATVKGTHLTNWPLLSPAQVENLLNAGIKTIEEAAAMDDQIATSLDSGVFIRSKARYWINASDDIGAVASELASLRAENATLREDNNIKAQRLEEQRVEIERLTLLVTGKDGFDVIAGRVQAVPGAGARGGTPNVAAVAAAAPPPPPAPKPAYEDVAALSASDFRSFCYERNVKPGPDREESLAALVQLGEVLEPRATEPPVDEPDSRSPTTRKGKRV